MRMSVFFFGFEIADIVSILRRMIFSTDMFQGVFSLWGVFLTDLLFVVVFGVILQFCCCFCL